jgi:hypothetical protein
MITLNIEVPEARDRTAIALLKRGTKKLVQGFAAASASPQIAAARGNAACDPLRAWGHPPTGTYWLINHRAANKSHSGEYGMHLMLFEPASGAALDAQAAGRVALLVYGGPSGQDKRMRRTQGGVRLSNDMLSAIIKQVAHDNEITLTIETLRKPSWWQFWKSIPDTPMLSTTVAKAYPAPLDEMSIILELMNGARRRSHGGSASDDYRERERYRDDNRHDHSSSGSRSDSDTFRGSGGQSGGGGASGGWDSATSTARGVDASGRIVAGAAIGAAAAIAANAAAGATANDSNNSGISQFTDGGSDSGGSSDRDSSSISVSDTSSSASTSASTSY